MALGLMIWCLYMDKKKPPVALKITKVTFSFLTLFLLSFIDLAGNVFSFSVDLFTKLEELDLGRFRGAIPIVLFRYYYYYYDC